MLENTLEHPNEYIYEDDVYNIQRAIDHLKYPLAIGTASYFPLSDLILNIVEPQDGRIYIIKDYEYYYE
jgi:hypothetical protein